MPAVLLQILLTPALAAMVVFLTRKTIGRFAGWIVAFALLYTTVLVVLVGIEVYEGAVIAEEYLIIAPGIRLGLLADGLSVPTLAIVILLCTTLAFYSIRYIERRVEILYHRESERARIGHYARFFYLLPFFPIQYTNFRFTACRHTVDAILEMRGIVNVCKEGGHGVEILHFEWIKLMLVALGTSQRSPHPYFRQVSHPVRSIHGNVLLGLNPAFVGGLEQTIITGGNDLTGGGLGE